MLEWCVNFLEDMLHYAPDVNYKNSNRVVEEMCW
jgi:hypothetical protein